MSENKKKESVFTKRGFFVALVVAVSLMVIMLVMNLITDISYSLLDPRVKLD